MTTAFWDKVQKNDYRNSGLRVDDAVDFVLAFIRSLAFHLCEHVDCTDIDYHANGDT